MYDESTRTFTKIWRRRYFGMWEEPNMDQIPVVWRCVTVNVNNFEVEERWSWEYVVPPSNSPAPATTNTAGGL